MNALIEKRKQNWIDFYDVKSPVNRLIQVEYGDCMARRPMLWWENMEKLHDNTIPNLNMLTGTEIFAEAFGCKVHKPVDNNPFAVPLIKDVSEWYKIKKPKWEDTNLVKLFETADRLKARVGEDALFSLPDVQTPMDIASLIWDKSDFYAAMEKSLWHISRIIICLMESPCQRMRSVFTAVQMQNISGKV